LPHGNLNSKNNNVKKSQKLSEKTILKTQNKAAEREEKTSRLSLSLII